jgi:hypothetical protein
MAAAECINLPALRRSGRRATHSMNGRTARVYLCRGPHASLQHLKSHPQAQNQVTIPGAGITDRSQPLSSQKLIKASTIVTQPGGVGCDGKRVVESRTSRQMYLSPELTPIPSRGGPLSCLNT